MNTLDNPKFAEAQRQFEAACMSSRMHSELAAKALAIYGDHGPLISGCIRDHFPEDTKANLRFWARSVSKHSDLAHAAKPKRIRRATIIALGRAVATRDGSGFYGPQPIRQS